MISITLSEILIDIKDMVIRWVGGTLSGTSQPIDGYLKSLVSFIVNHPLILFFILSSFLYIGIRLIRRMIHT